MQPPVPVQRVGALVLQTPRQHATQAHPCLSFPTNPVPIHAPCEDEGAAWEHRGGDGGAEAAQRVCSQPPSLRWVCGGTGDASVPRALVLSRLSGERHISEEPFDLCTPPRQAELRTHGQELPSHPASARGAPAPTAPHPATPAELLGRAALPQTPFAVGRLLPPRRFPGVRVAALLSHALPLLDSFRIREMCSFHFRSGRTAVFCLLGSSQGLKPPWGKGR